MREGCIRASPHIYGKKEDMQHKVHATSGITGDTAMNNPPERRAFSVRLAIECLGASPSISAEEHMHDVLSAAREFEAFISGEEK